MFFFRCQNVTKNSFLINRIVFFCNFGSFRSKSLQINGSPPKSCFQVIITRFSSLYDAETRTLVFSDGKRYTKEDLLDTGLSLFSSSIFLNSNSVQNVEVLVDALYEYARRLCAVRLTQTQLTIFSAIALISAGINLI